MSSICSQGSADSVSDSSGPGCEPSPSVRSNLSPVPSSPSIGRTSPAITTSMTLQQTDWIGMESVESTSSAAATLASPFPTPGSKEATKIRVTSGRKCAELLAKSDPLGYLLKMLLVTSRWGSTRCLLTWKPMATQRGRLLFRLVPKTPPTSGSESGSWPLLPDDGLRSGEGPGPVQRGRQEPSRWLPEPRVGRVAHGIPRRMDRLRALGNAVVPQVVEEIGRAIMACKARRA